MLKRPVSGREIASGEEKFILRSSRSGPRSHNGKQLLASETGMRPSPAENSLRFAETDTKCASGYVKAQREHLIREEIPLHYGKHLTSYE